METAGTGNLIVNTDVAFAVLPLVSVTTATSVYWPSSNGFSGLNSNEFSPSSPSSIFKTSSPSKVRLNDTGSASPENSPLMVGWLISYISTA